MRLPDTVTFRGEVYAWDGQKATGPNLYESAPRTTSGSGSFEEITFDTDGVQLTPGQQYVLFATISKDYEASNGFGEWGAISADPYAGGTFTYMNNGPFFDQLFTNAWEKFVGWDLAFKAVFSSPAPTTKADCKKGGYKEFGFKNQGQCIKAVNHASK